MQRIDQQKPRTLVLCFDGTALKFDNNNTNVVKFVATLKRNDPESQLVYYQTGIGTYTPPGFNATLQREWVKLKGQAFGTCLEHHVMGGYRFLMNTYRPGDSICLFGFSRGAYTARALAGMLYKVGLLSEKNEELVPFAYELFRNPKSYRRFSNTQGKAFFEAQAFRETFSRTVTVEFIGVWDTVSSVGFFPRTLPHTATNPSVKTIRHAIALDEGRHNFRVNYWGWKGPTATRQNDVKEVWFAGEHSDIGGGIEKDWEEHSLSHISLRWMIRECLEKTGINFHEQALIDRKILSDDGIERNPREDTYYKAFEYEDANCRSHPSFTWKSLWWVLEYIPVKRNFQDSTGKWKKPVWRLNACRGRWIRPEPTTLVHSSVLTRINIKDKNYTPRAKLPDNVEWVY